MKNKFNFLLLILVMITFITNIINVKAEEKKVDVYLFYSQTCPHCKAEIKMLDELAKENNIIIVHKYEINDPENNRLFKKKAKELGASSSYVPFTIVGKNYFIGYSEFYTKQQIIDAINKELSIKNNDNNQNSNKIIKVPIIGKIEVKGVLLPVIAVIMGTLDGFNPCAMWILLFLISVLIGMKDKKRMWILGLTFIITSALMYTLVMIGWLKVVESLSWLRYVVACLAIIGGAFNLGTLIRKKNDGCEVIDDRKRKKIFIQIKKFTGEQKLILAVIGIMILAILVNLVELVCSAGLPLGFTQILAENEISKIGYFIYILIYIFFFMLDDIIVFVIAMLTLNLTGFSTKYGKISKIIGGIILIIIGILLIFNPKLLSFS